MPILPIVAMVTKLALVAKLATLVNMLTQAFFCLPIQGYDSYVSPM